MHEGQEYFKQKGIFISRTRLCNAREYNGNRIAIG